MAKSVAKPETKKAAVKPVAVKKVAKADPSPDLESKTAEELLAVIAEKDDKIAEQEQVISELMESNASASESVADAETVDVAGVKYKVAIKSFIHAGKRLTAADVLANPEIAAKLVLAKSPALKKV